MRKTILAGVASAFLFTGISCGSTDITALIQQVQADAVQVCGFVPTAETIAAIFAANNPTLQTALSIANAICAAVVPHSATKTATPDATIAGATVAGVPVKGHWVVK